VGLAARGTLSANTVVKGERRSVVANEKLMYDGAFSGLAATGELNRLLDEVYGLLKQASAGEAPPQVVEVFDPARESEGLMDLCRN
jgi:hypothetical protein